MATYATETLLDGLMFTEGPRWRDGRLYFSDMHDHRVIAVDEQGRAETIVEVPASPSGLGWLPDGRMLVVSMQDRRLLRLERDGKLAEVANLSHLAPFHLNDMVVDRQGRAYVGNFGFDLYGSGTQRKTCLILVEPDGKARVVADELAFPNGTVITPDGLTLIIAESYAGQLTAFDIREDGSLADRRDFAKLAGVVPDGICLDAEGCIWVACAVSHRCVRVREGGEIVDQIPLAAPRNAFACMLGGSDRRTLFVCTSTTHNPEECKAERSARIERCRVPVGGAGLP